MPAMNLQLFPHLLRFHRRLLIAIAIGALVAAFMPVPLSSISRALVGWNAGSWAYLLMIWFMIVTAPRERIRDIAEHEDESAVVVLTVISLSAIASVVAIIQVLATAKGTLPHLTIEHVAFAATTLIASWLLVPTIYTLHYARLYFTDTDA